MSSVPVIKFLFRSEWKVLSEALKINPVYDSEAFGTAAELSTFLSGNSAGMVVCSLRDKNDLIQLAMLMKLVRKAAPNTLIKVIVVNFSGEKQFEKAVAKLGILDMVEDRIQTKALRFKIDFMMKSINAHQKRVAAAPAASAVKNLEQNKAQDKKNLENTPTWNPPLENSNDIWILKNESDCKKVLTRWLVKMMGPSPYVAQWIETKSPGIWKFDFKNEHGDFVEGKGAWFYRGDQKPDFVWAENIWLFTSPSFDLFYQEEGETVSRMSLKDRQLRIAKNSEYARTKESSIVESFDKEFAFRKESEGKADAEAFEKEQNNFKNLEGKGKTDSLHGGPLSGKGKTSHLNSDPLSMDLEPGENDLSSDPLSQKNSGDKKSSFWKGNNKHFEESSADLEKPTENAPNSGAELSLDGKSSVEKYLKNHNKAEEFAAKDIGHAIKKDGVSDNLKGKTSTDELKGHLSSPEASKQLAEKQAKDMSGKTSTDKLAGPLSSPDGSKGQVEKQAKDMSGKTSTDKLAGPLSSPDGSKGHAEKNANDLNGKSSTDDLGGALSSKDGKKHSEKSAKDMSGKTSTDEIQGHLSSENNTDHPSKKNASHKSQFISNDSFEKEDEAEGNVVDLQTVKREAGKKAERINKELEQAALADAQEAQAFEDSTQNAKVTSVLIQNGHKVSCKLDDYFDQTIIFSTKQNGITSEQEVTLNLNFNYMNKDTNLRFAGNVSQIDADDEGSQYITVEISDENTKAFNSFMKLYETRQENINLFFKTVKGY